MGGKPTRLGRRMDPDWEGEPGAHAPALGGKQNPVITTSNIVEARALSMVGSRAIYAARRERGEC